MSCPRDSKDPTGPALLFSSAAVNDLVDALRRRECSIYQPERPTAPPYRQVCRYGDA
nr:DUF397 domain-containing protein [Streptomyces sp. LUP30]